MFSLGNNGKGFTEHSISLCLKLIEVLQSVEKDLVTGDITVQHFEMIDSKWDCQVYPILTALKWEIDPFKCALTKTENHVLLFKFYCALIRFLMEHLDSKLEGNGP